MPNDAATLGKFERDLALVLVGAVLSREPEVRRRVLDIKPEVFSREVQVLLDGIRSGDGKPIREWFAERGAPIADGKDAIQAAGDLLQRSQKKARLAVLGDMVRNCRVEDCDDIVSRLRSIADEVETLK